MKPTQFRRTLLVALPILSFALPVWSAPQPSAEIVPDLTQTIDFERKGEYHLGPTGAKGWIYTPKNFMTTRARQILITQVATGSVADGVLEVGDVILGVGDKHFTTDARMAFGNAIDSAEQKENGGVMEIIRWRAKKGATPRAGSETKVKLKLKVMGSFSDAAPWDCPKTKRIMDDALKVLTEQKDFGKFGASALALLATGEKQYIDLVSKYIHEVKWAKPDIELSLKDGGLVVWSYGYQNLLLTEYFLLTGDKYVLPAIREYSVKLSMGQSAGGVWGHGLAWTIANNGKLHGALRGYGALNQAALPCFLSLMLAKKCGIEHEEIDAAIERSNGFFSQFINHGSIGYGYHRPSLEIYASGRNGMSGNGKNGIAAIAFQVKGNDEARAFFAKLTASLYNTMEYGHSGNSYSYFWDPLGANAGGPKLTASFLKKLRWYYALTRKADGSFVNQPLGGHYGKGLLDPTAAQVLIATMPRKAIYLTGKGQNRNDGLSENEATKAVDSGKWRTANKEAMSVDQLLTDLHNWSPIAREWAAKTLATKQGDFIDRLLKLLKSDHATARAGACAALGHLGKRAARAVPEIAKALTDDDNTVCIAAGYALARIGKPAEQALPDLLRAVITSNETDSMRPKQQALAYAFGHVQGRTAPLYFNGLLAQVANKKNPLDGLDRKLLYSGITKLLHDPSGRTRGSGAYAFQFFNRDDVAAMAQGIYHAVETRSLGYKMFEDLPRARGLGLMARFHIKEGIPLCIETLGLGRWGGGERFHARFQTLQAYGGHAKPYLPQLIELRKKFKPGAQRDMLEEAIKVIESDDASKRPPLISLHDLVDERLTKDLAKTSSKEQRILLCRKLMEQNLGDYFYQAAGLRILVAELGAGAFDDILISLSKRSEVLRESAVVMGAKLTGDQITQKWIAALGTSKDTQLVGIIDILAQRKGTKTRAAIGKYLKHENDAVRAAATRALDASDTSSPGWQADRKQVEAWKTKRRPGINYDESRVPKYQLPDPLKTPEGKPITTAQEWKLQRPGLLKLFRENVYGTRPTTAYKVDYKEVGKRENAFGIGATARQIRATISAGGKTHSFDFVIVIPKSESKSESPVPIIVQINNRYLIPLDKAVDAFDPFWPVEKIVRRGYATAVFHTSDVDPDKRDGYKKGIRYLLGDPHPDSSSDPDTRWGSLSAWGWGASRVLDFALKLPEIDSERTAVVGHSRGGKTALWATAEDQRFKIAYSNNSGCGGAALSRRAYGETVKRITGNFPHWFCKCFKTYSDRENELPIDQHQLIGLIAPRAVYVASADKDLWADPRGEYTSLVGAAPIYNLFGIKAIKNPSMPALDSPRHVGATGYHIRRGVHNLTEQDWGYFLDFSTGYFKTNLR